MCWKCDCICHNRYLEVNVGLALAFHRCQLEKATHHVEALIGKFAGLVPRGRIDTGVLSVCLGSSLDLGDGFF